ncbi:glycosidase [Sphaerochaeta halotolerans]|jgi:predicted GH43/DUF377 family glycosyl hydrolase|uniref:Glycosidase n=1 Tax=Sphaerochaeta halotolerans TaxID=2293840 RepID=A0A372MJN6_9SPIR|nr:glycosidase [Sphaerochaeta halotolerans]MBG0767610.1 glycosidase [Spirochaetaceae bacterium]MXI86050.1 glycosidase [Sphaerochaeta halotolerans]RFU95653.1 glycosidase [Sphaerochaeta halotolerans]
MGKNELFTRFEGNPIITVQDLPYQANAVFNPAAVRIGEETLLLMRVEDRRGLSHLTVARSKDGITDWHIDAVPTMAPQAVSHPEELWGIEDPRITYLEPILTWAVVYTSYSKGGPLVSMALTDDFKHFERKGSILPPEDKDAAFFPVQFGRRWAMIHRPYSSGEGTGSHIWISFSPDMQHWGDHQILIPARKGGWWDANKVGLCPPPLRTDKGWLIMYHGVQDNASGSIYRLGLALADLEDPTILLARSDEWVFAPQMPYEMVGNVDKVVFPCGWILDGESVRIYYGCADTCIGCATASLTELFDWLETHNMTAKQSLGLE